MSSEILGPVSSPDNVGRVLSENGTRVWIQGVGSGMGRPGMGRPGMGREEKGWDGMGWEECVGVFCVCACLAANSLCVSG